MREPTITSLTRIGTVEGFGSMIRHVHPGDMQRFFVESIDGTAIQHLDRGLFEAHARDEAGWEAEGGHKQMWFAARDVAFESPVTEDETQTMLPAWASVRHRANRRIRKRCAKPPRRCGGSRIST